MSARRLHWQGSTRERQLRERLDAVLAGWVEAWSAEPARVQPTSARTDSGPLPGDLRWLRATGKAGALWLGATEEGFDALGSRLAAADPVDELGLGRRVGERALRDLVAQWLGVVVADVEPTVAPSTQELDRRHGGLRWRIAVGDLEWRVFVDDALCAQWLPESRPAAEPPAARAACVAAERITLDLQLDLGTTTLAETHGLQVGDVLVSGTRLDALFRLATPAGQRLAAARLHQHGDRRAIQVRAAQDDKTK
jgi:hypothetical protein